MGGRGVALEVDVAEREIVLRRSTDEIAAHADPPGDFGAGEFDAAG
jgi:hypothetical protein